MSKANDEINKQNADGHSVVISVQSADEQPHFDPSDHSEMERLAEEAAQSIFRAESQMYVRGRRKLIEFTSSTTRAACFMLIAAVIALIVANTGAYEVFLSFWETEFGFVIGTGEITLTFAEIINDIFMAIFFLLVGLDIKYEMTVGELKNIRQAILPIMAAVGGVCAPIVIYTICNIASPETAHGWGVPTATDIAFAIGIMALLGNRVPNGVRVFLSTLAVADDIIAIFIIAVFYGQSPSFFWLGMTLLVTIVLVVMNRVHVYSLTPYLLVGIVLWYCVFMSGVHATIAGVILAMTIPTGSRINLKSFISWSKARVAQAESTFDKDAPLTTQSDYLKTIDAISYVAREVTPPATRLEHALFPWVYFAILPLFALTNADVNFVTGDVAAMFANPALYGVFFGLLLGKPIGILLMTFIIVKLRIASLPANCNWMHMAGAGILGGVGFTMAIFVANLAFTNPADIVAAKVGILCASFCAGVIGFLFLSAQAKKAKRGGVAYLATKGDEAFAPTIDSEITEKSAAMLREIDSPLIRQELEEALKAGSGIAEVVVDLGEDNRRSDAVAAEQAEAVAAAAAATAAAAAAEAAAAAAAAEAAAEAARKAAKNAAAKDAAAKDAAANDAAAEAKTAAAEAAEKQAEE